MSDQQEPRVIIDADALSLTIDIPENADPAFVNRDAFDGMIAAAGIPVTPALKSALDRLSVSPTPGRHVVARAEPPTPGRAGSLQWRPNFDPTDSSAPSDGKVDLYAARKTIQVNIGDHLADVIPPTDGADGRDVRGRVLRAVSGKPARVLAGKGISVDSTGRVLASEAGILDFSKDEIRILKVLDVQDCVDFSTGSIDFQGDVSIRHGIQDNFTVRASGNISIGGLVAGANIHCGGNLACSRGIAARHRGIVEVGGDARIGYLDHVKARIQGSLTIDNEIMNSELVVGKDLVCSGSLVGGTTSIGRALRLADLGNEAEIATEIHLGTLPLVSGAIKDLDHQVGQLEQEAAKLTQTLDLLKLSRRPTPAEREQMTEVSYQLEELRTRQRDVESRKLELLARKDELRTIKIEIDRSVFPRVIFVADEQRVEINRRIKGPARIGCNEHYQLSIQIGNGQPQPLTDFARAGAAQARRSAA